VVISYSKKAFCTCIESSHCGQFSLIHPIRRGLRRVGRRDGRGIPNRSVKKLTKQKHGRDDGNQIKLNYCCSFLVDFVVQAQHSLTVEQGRELWVTDYRSWCSSTPPPPSAKTPHQDAAGTFFQPSGLVIIICASTQRKLIFQLHISFIKLRVVHS